MSVASEVSSDLIIQVKGHRYLLHKFPLLSKCLRLQKQDDSQSQLQIQSIHLTDFPSGPEAFELCAKFCYGITITLSAYNIVPILCAAEYLQMTEEAEKGNLIYKLDVFFNSCILRGWRDSIVALQTTKAFHHWSQKVGITARCIDSIATKVAAAHPSNVKPTIKGGWWGEDLAELGIDLYWRTMVAIKSIRKVPGKVFGDALRAYASRWLPDMSSEMDSVTPRHRMVLESIVALLPKEKGSVSCRFLLKLLKVANMVKASSSSKTKLATRIALQLEEATVGDLLVPPSLSTNANGIVYDVEIIMNILEQFISQGKTPPTSPPRNNEGMFERPRSRSRSAEGFDLELQESRKRSSVSHSSKLKVAKLVDEYLQQIAKDKNLPLSKFIGMAESIPGFSRLDHDDLYKAIDIYLKMHPNLNKKERKRLCRILDCKRLSLEACMHAA